MEQPDFKNLRMSGCKRVAKQIVKNLINKSPFGYTDIIGKVGNNPNEYAGIKTVNL
ncbi:MAG: hypothetical protein NC429_09325 [Lachnospiraceae bacterium]|nr:hypothetical protein [Lachnospiraceae bacterium]